MHRPAAVTFLIAFGASEKSRPLEKHFLGEGIVPGNIARRRHQVLANITHLAAGYPAKAAGAARRLLASVKVGPGRHER